MAKPQAARVGAYAEAVTSGRIQAGWMVRAAAQRHIDDLLSGPARGLVWREDRAEAAINFFEKTLYLSDDIPFILDDWQAFIVGSLLGWWQHDAESGGLVRRFRTFYGETGKGNGKTPIAAGLGLLFLEFGLDPAPECYSAAAAKEQARICFSDAARMVEASPALRDHIDALTGSLTIAKRHAKFIPLSSEDRGHHGKRVSFAALDELHAHGSAKMARAMIAGTKNCKNALICIITNSGHDRRSICWSYHETSRRVLEREMIRDDLFAYVCTLDPCPACFATGWRQPDPKCPSCDAWHDPSKWIKANPGLGTICRRAYVAERVTTAQTMPSELNDVLQLNFCQWTESAGGWANMHQWDNVCADPALDIAQFAGRRAALAMDAANRVDVTSLVAVIERDPGSGTLDTSTLNAAARTALAQATARADADDRPSADAPAQQAASARALAAAGYVVFDWHFVPRALVENSSQENFDAYQQWWQAGELIVTEGAVTDFAAIMEKIRSLAAHLQVVRYQCDPRELGYFMQQLQTAPWCNFEIVQVSQSPAMISQPMKELEALIAAGLIQHRGGPVLRWMLANVVQKTTRSGGPMKYYFPSRAADARKIDGAVSLIMGIDGILRQSTPQPAPFLMMVG